MSTNSSIEWTDHTFNPWWGCSAVSPGCAHCYAKNLATRFRYDVWGRGAGRRTFGDAHWRVPISWNRQAQRLGIRKRVFCASMADVFDPDGPRDQSDRLWALIDDTRWLDWQLLTKRPHLVHEMIPKAWAGRLPNHVWIGTSIEDAGRLARLDVLRMIRASVRFISLEPLLEDLGRLDLTGIHWVIGGGESGHRARPMHPAWVRSIRDQCARDRVAFFFKQWGTDQNNPDPHDPTARSRGGHSKGGCLLDGQTHQNFPMNLETV